MAIYLPNCQDGNCQGGGPCYTPPTSCCLYNANLFLTTDSSTPVLDFTTDAPDELIYDHHLESEGGCDFASSQHPVTKDILGGYNGYNIGTSPYGAKMLIAPVNTNDFVDPTGYPPNTIVWGRIESDFGIAIYPAFGNQINCIPMQDCAQGQFFNGLKDNFPDTYTVNLADADVVVTRQSLCLWEGHFTPTGSCADRYIYLEWDGLANPNGWGLRSYVSEVCEASSFLGVKTPYQNTPVGTYHDPINGDQTVSE